jgi:hypothetical protein
MYVSYRTTNAVQLRRKRFPTKPNIFIVYQIRVDFGHPQTSGDDPRRVVTRLNRESFLPDLRIILGFRDGRVVSELGLIAFGPKRVDIYTFCRGVLMVINCYLFYTFSVYLLIL